MFRSRPQVCAVRPRAACHAGVACRRHRSGSGHAVHPDPRDLPPDRPHPGRQPDRVRTDGDSIQFEPANPWLLDQLTQIARPYRLSLIGSTQLRLEAIDALELHFDSTLSVPKTSSTTLTCAFVSIAEVRQDHRHGRRVRKRIHAARRYSWSRPPSRSRRCTTPRRSSPPMVSPLARSGA